MHVGAAQLVALLIPLITVPWILRALQPSAYGKYALAIAIGQYAVIVIDFGFYLAATKRVALVRDDREELTRYFWAVQSARALLATLGAIVAMSVVILVPKFRPLASITALYLPSLLGTLLYPTWLFYGLELIRVASLVNIVGRTLAALPVFLLVKSPSDAGVAAFLNAMGVLISGIISCFLIARWKLLDKFKLPHIGDVIAAFRDAWPLFVSSVAVSLYSISNTVILGLVRDSYQVGLFSAADKLRSVATMPVTTISSVYFPRVSRTMAEDRIKAVRMITGLALFVGVVMAALSATLFFGATWLVKFLMGDDFGSAVPVVRILAITPFFVGLTTVFGTIAMVNFGMQEQGSKIVVAGGLLNIVLLVTLGSLYGARGAAMSLTITEMVVMTATGYSLYRIGYFREAAASLPSRRGRSRGA